MGVDLNAAVGRRFEADLKEPKLSLLFEVSVCWDRTVQISSTGPSLSL